MLKRTKVLGPKVEETAQQKQHRRKARLFRGWAPHPLHAGYPTMSPLDSPSFGYAVAHSYHTHFRAKRQDSDSFTGFVLWYPPLVKQQLLQVKRN